MRSQGEEKNSQGAEREKTGCKEQKVYVGATVHEGANHSGILMSMFLKT